MLAALQDGKFKCTVEIAPLIHALTDFCIMAKNNCCHFANVCTGQPQQNGGGPMYGGGAGRGQRPADNRFQPY